MYIAESTFDLLVPANHAYYDLMRRIFLQKEFDSPVERKVNILLKNL